MGEPLSLTTVEAEQKCTLKTNAFGFQALLLSFFHYLAEFPDGLDKLLIKKGNVSVRLHYLGK